jgi:hypothetical protein
VRLYLEALESARPKRGRKRTADSIQDRITAIGAALPNAGPIQKLELVQEKIDLEAELEAPDAQADLTELEDSFVEAASAYGERKGISYIAWRSVGVPAAVLKRAGIGRGV